MMKFLLLILLVPCWLFATDINAKGLKGFVTVRKDHQLYVDWSYAKPGHPTVVLLNGLTYSTTQWDRFADELISQGFGVLRFDPCGMGQTLLMYAPVLADIQIEDQVQDMHDLIHTLKLETPLNLVGLSYGGGLGILYAGTYPEEVGKLIAMAPYTEPLKSQNDWIMSQIWYTRQVAPWNTATDDELYAYFFRQIVYSTYPSVEPVVLENPYKLEAIFRMGLGIRKYKSLDAAKKMPPNSFHLVIAGRDQYIPRGILEEFWTQVPVSIRASKLIIANSEHKIPEDVPRFSASWVMSIINNTTTLRQESTYEADPFTGIVKFPGGEIQLTKEY